MRDSHALSNQNDDCRRQNHLHKSDVQCAWKNTERILMV